ncbi:hypothetical protein HAX54_053247 [Datura stramonium]|uniref:Uncharacterized protein n=1 Tax=Datura stramonium TaxID=4076 RepID=A0ABS8T039_DATST|nr:hypothetical protein [Datura stramonium]
MEDPKNKIQDQSCNELAKEALGDDSKMIKPNPSSDVPPPNNNNNKNNTQNQGQPTNVPPQGQVLDEYSQSQKQEQVQEEEEENEDDFEPLPRENGPRAERSRPPGKISGPKPKTN